MLELRADERVWEVFPRADDVHQLIYRTDAGAGGHSVDGFSAQTEFYA